MSRPLLISTILLSMQAVSEQQAAPASPYEVDEAYRVYSVLLAREESYEFAKGALVIQEETVSEHLASKCLTAAATRKFKDAIVDYERANSKQWILQRLFHSEKPYGLVSSDAIKTAFQERFWDSFNARYPGLVDTSLCPPSVSTAIGRWQLFIRAVLVVVFVDAGGFTCWRKLMASGKQCRVSLALRCPEWESTNWAKNCP